MTDSSPTILLIIEGTYPWYRGGVSEWVYQYLKNLSANKVHILQVATDEFQDLDPQEALYPITENVVSFTRISPPESVLNWESDKIDWFNSVKKNLSYIDVDLIHVTNTGFAGWLGVKLSEILDKPLVLTEHALYWKEVEMGAVALECGYKVPNTDTDKLHISSIFKNIATEIYSKAEKVISVSKINIPEQINLGAQDPVYIPNGISKHLIVTNKTRSEIPHIGWVGRCAEMKNPLKFFEIIEHFRTHNFDANFSMIISDANEKSLEKEVKIKAEEFPELTMVWNKNAINYIPDLDLLCITSYNESQPLVLFEALANKALPFGWKVGDVDEDFALVVNKESNTDILVKEVIKMWNNKPLFNEKVNYSFNITKNNHTWESIFSKYELNFNLILSEYSI